jgi:hypothetical protein
MSKDGFDRGELIKSRAEELRSMKRKGILQLCGDRISKNQFLSPSLLKISEIKWEFAQLKGNLNKYTKEIYEIGMQKWRRRNTTNEDSR